MFFVFAYSEGYGDIGMMRSWHTQQCETELYLFWRGA